MKPVTGKLRRHGRNYFTTVILPVNQMAETDVGLDVLGGVMVVSLSVTLVFLMRLILAD